MKGTWEISMPFLQLFCKPKIISRQKVYKQQKDAGPLLGRILFRADQMIIYLLSIFSFLKYFIPASKAPPTANVTAKDFQETG